MRNREEKKCKKGQESTIGKIIYGFLLFMPLLAIGITCLITTFNMSAKQETKITYKYETNEINSINDIHIGNIYHFNSNTFSNVPSQTLDEFTSEYSEFYIQGNILNFTKNSEFVYSQDDTDFANGTYNEFGSVLIYSGTYPYNFTYWTNSNGNYPNTFIIDEYNENILIEFDIVITNINISMLNQQFNNANYNNLRDNFTNSFSNCENIPIESVETHNIDSQEVFYYSVDKVEQSNLFNWAQNSVIYTTTNATCNALSINNTFIPLLLSYWLIISVLYFLYDIALMLVWIIHKKIHEMQESI